MFNYQSGTLSAILDENDKKLSVLQALKSPATISQVCLRLDDGKVEKFVPSKIEANIVDRCLYITTSNVIYKVHGITRRVFLSVKDAHFEIRPVIGDYGEPIDREKYIKVFLKKDLWKVWNAFSDPDAEIFLVDRSIELGRLKSLTSLFGGKLEAETFDRQKYVLKLR